MATFSTKLVRTLATVCFTLGLPMAGCDSSKPAEGDAAAAASTPDGKATDDAAVQGRIKAAIECINNYSGRVFEVRDDYLNSVDPATGAPPGAQAPALLGMGNGESCVKNLKDAVAIQPAMPDLDGPALAYATALQSVGTEWEAITDYYKRGDFVDDKGEKLKTLHPKVVSAFEAFSSAHEALSTKVGALNRERSLADLAKREKAEGRTLEVILAAMMLEAETLVDLLSSAKAENAAALRTQIDAYTKLLDELTAYASAHPDEASKRGSFANIKNYSSTFLAASKVIARKLSEGAALEGREQSDAIEQYNRLIDNFNH